MASDKKPFAIFKNSWFNRFAKRENISDETLKDAIKRAEEGLIDANLGGHVIKQRIARNKQGKSGGYRTIIVFKKNDKAFFVFGFAKNEQDNISKSDKDNFKKLAKELLELTPEQIEKLIEIQELMEIEP